MFVVEITLTVYVPWLNLLGDDELKPDQQPQHLRRGFPESKCHWRSEVTSFLEIREFSLAVRRLRGFCFCFCFSQSFRGKDIFISLLGLP